MTPDHVNPEAPWPHLADLADQTRAAGKQLVERLAIYPAYAHDTATWIAKDLRHDVHKLIDARGLARRDEWMAGTSQSIPSIPAAVGSSGAALTPNVLPSMSRIIDRAMAGTRLGEREITRLFESEGADVSAIVAAADALRRDACGDTVTYVVNRNINYTNVCYFRCQFCAFSKGKMSENLRGEPYVLNLEEIERRTARGVAARGERSLPPGRYSSQLHRRHLS